MKKLLITTLSIMTLGTVFAVDLPSTVSVSLTETQIVETQVTVDTVSITSFSYDNEKDIIAVAIEYKVAGEVIDSATVTIVPQGENYLLTILRRSTGAEQKLVPKDVLDAYGLPTLKAQVNSATAQLGTVILGL